MDQTTNRSKKQFIAEEDTSNLNNNESQLKTLVFSVFFVLLKDQSFSIYTTCVLVAIQFLQTISLAFQSLTSAMWNDTDITDVVQDILGYFGIVFYFKQTNWNVYVACLYIIIAILVVVLLDIFYINFAFSRRKISFSWPVVILKNVLLLFTTILFLPFNHFFISFLDCVDDAKGNKVHTYFTEIECWSGMHILHSVFAVVALIVFSAISLTASLLLFEYRTNSNNPNTRITSRPNFFLNFYLLLTIICLTFFTGNELQIIVLAIILFCSTVLFALFHFRCPYHDEVMTKMWSLFTALNLWVALMLVFAKVMEGVLFEGSVVALIVGLPFVGYIVVINRDHRINLLLININKFKSHHEVIGQIRYVLKLIQWQGTKKNASALLNGYVEIHKKSCNREDCPLRQKLAKNNRFAKSLMTKDENVNEKYALLIQLLFKTYSEAIIKFPKSVELRISYAFFLLEKMHSRQQALQELFVAETNKPTIDEEFLIFRYKKLIEDEIAESQNENQNSLDLVTESTFQNHLRQIQANIEKATLLYMEFWSQLTEETPDLAKLNDIGSKISASVQTVEDNWVKLLKVNSNNANAMKLYGKFLLEIINDQEGGEALLEKSRNLLNAQTNKKTMNAIEGSDNNHDATPIIWMSGEQENTGIITGVNLVAASMFGYSKNELVNRKIETLMPDVYGKYHESFIENYLNGGESTLITKNKERLVFGKHKTEYIFPVYLNIKAVQSIIQGIQFIATFRVEKNFKSVAYVLTDPEGVIDGLTSSCLNVLKIDQRAINQKKENIETYVPDIIANRAHIFPKANNAGKSTATIQYRYPRDFELINEGEGNSAMLHVQLHELSYLGGKEKAGFQFRFERVVERVQYDEETRSTKISNFMFRHDFEQTKVTFCGEYVDKEAMKADSGRMGYLDEFSSDPDKPDQESSFMRNSMRSVSDIWKVKIPPKEEENEEQQEVKRKDYGVGIKTLRLFHGKPMEIEDDKSDENGSDSDDTPTNGGSSKAGKPKKKSEEAHQQVQEEADDDDAAGDFNHTLKSRKQLNAIVSDRAPPPTIKNLKRVVNLACLCLALVSIIDYIIASKDFNNIEKRIDLLDKSNLNTAELMNVLSRTRDRYLREIGLVNAASTLDVLLEATSASLESSKGLTEFMEAESSILSNEHQQLLDDPIIPLYDINGGVTYKGLTQATQEIITRAYSLVSQTSINVDDPNYYFVTRNLLNDFYLSLRNSTDMYATQLYKRVEDQPFSFLILLIMSIIILMATLSLLFLIFFQINKSRESVLSLFLDIPEKTVKSLFGKCEGFITNLQLGEEEDLWSQFDDEELDRTQLDTTNNNTHEFIPRKKRKHFKNSGRSQKAFFFKFFFIAAVVEAYFIFIFVHVNQLLSNINLKLTEFNATETAEPFYIFMMNAERQTIIDKTWQILNQEPVNLTRVFVKAMYDLDADILQLHADHRNIHTSSYSETFNQIMMADPCGAISDTEGLDCSTYADQSVAQGMSVASTRYFENTRLVIRCYVKIEANEQCAIDLDTTVSLPNPPAPQAPWSAQQLLKFGLFYTNEAQEAKNLQYIFIKQSFRALNEAFKQSFSDEFSSALTVRLIVFIVFLVLIATVYILLWLPLVRKINTDIWRTKSMLSMIPLNVISKIKSVKVFLKKFWNQRNMAEY